MQDLKVALIQSEIHWHDIDANLAMFEEKIWQIQDFPQLIVLPEMFNTGFTNATHQLGEMINMKTFRWMKQMASQSNAVITGSYIVKEDDIFYNRLIWMMPDGNYLFYDKKHLFILSDEHEHFLPGREKLIVELKGWKICPMICYDLRFPVWSRNQWNGSDLEYDVLLYTANWPEARINAWDTLLRARAIENLSYSIGLNRVGKDGNNLSYNGHSGIYDPLGEMEYFAEDMESIKTVTLSREKLEKIRKKLQFYRDADSFEIK